MLLDVSVTHVTMVSDAKCYVLDMVVVKTGNVCAMQPLGIKGNSAIRRDVLDGRKIAVVMVHVIWQRSNVHATLDGLDRHAAGLIVLELQTVTIMESVFLQEVSSFLKDRTRTSNFEKIL